MCSDDKRSSAHTVSAIAAESIAGLDGNSIARKRLFHRKLGKVIKRIRI